MNFWTTGYSFGMGIDTCIQHCCQTYPGSLEEMKAIQIELFIQVKEWGKGSQVSGEADQMLGKGNEKRDQMW